MVLTRGRAAFFVVLFFGVRAMLHAACQRHRARGSFVAPQRAILLAGSRLPNMLLTRGAENYTLVALSIGGGCDASLTVSKAWRPACFNKPFSYDPLQDFLTGTCTYDPLVALSGQIQVTPRDLNPAKIFSNSFGRPGTNLHIRGKPNCVWVIGCLGTVRKTILQ